MAYTRKNKLTLIIDIQTLTLEHTKKGVTQEWVYKNLIFPQYRISRSSFYSYLGCNAKQELRRLSTEPKQMQLF